jgi:alkylhydroperoxidase family enzyme
VGQQSAGSAWPAPIGNANRGSTMTEFAVWNETDAPKESRSVLKWVKSRYGYIPNFIGELAVSPVALRSYIALTNHYARSGLSSLEQKVVLLTTSFELDCEYCMAAHSTVARNLGLSDPDLEIIRLGRGIISDPRLQALHEFTRLAIRSHGRVNDAESQAFIRAGFTVSNMFEIVTGITLSTLSSFVNQMAKTRLDTSFVEMEWHKPLSGQALDAGWSDDGIDLRQDEMIREADLQRKEALSQAS